MTNLNDANKNEGKDFSFWKQFKSGTDIRGVAVDGVEGEPLNLTDEVVSFIAGGFVNWLCEKSGKKADQLKISVGRDSRISGPRIRDVVVERFLSHGAVVFDCGLASTPSMFMTTVDFPDDMKGGFSFDGCDGAVQITASHHPYHRNGLKFFTRDGGLESSNIEEILRFAHAGDFSALSDSGSVKEIDYISHYSEGLKNIIRKGVNSKENFEKPLEGFHIVVDAGNGAGGFYADKVLKPLGADVSGSQFLDPDGMFPNHVPNPEDKGAMKAICDATLKSKADVGIIFDTDVDRAGCVDSSGQEINRNRLIALASVIALESCEGGTIVTDSVTSSGLKVFIEQELGGKHHRFKRGYKNVINESIRLNNEGVPSPLAIETSGHAALKENYFLDDGAYLVTRIIVKAVQMAQGGKTLDSLIEKLAEPKEGQELRFNILADNFAQLGNEVLDKLEAYAVRKGLVVADDSHEGVRINFDKDGGDGWLLLRLSVHDPVMPLNIESDSFGGCKVIGQKLLEFFKEEENQQLMSKLDISALEKWL